MSAASDDAMSNAPVPAPAVSVPYESTPAVPPGVFAVSITTDADALKIHVLATETAPAVIATVVPFTRSG